MASALHRLSSLTCSVYRRFMTWNSGTPDLIRPFTTKSSPEQPISDLFHAWCKKYGKTYPSEKEKAKRLKIFEDTYKFVTEHNKNGASHRVALNEFADFDDKDMSYLCGTGK